MRVSVCVKFVRAIFKPSHHLTCSSFTTEFGGAGRLEGDPNCWPRFNALALQCTSMTAVCASSRRCVCFLIGSHRCCATTRVAAFILAVCFEDMAVLLNEADGEEFESKSQRGRETLEILLLPPPSRLLSLCCCHGNISRSVGVNPAREPGPNMWRMRTALV